MRYEFLSHVLGDGERWFDEDGDDRLVETDVPPNEDCDHHAIIVDGEERHVETAEYFLGMLTLKVVDALTPEEIQAVRKQEEEELKLLKLLSSK